MVENEILFSEAYLPPLQEYVEQLEAIWKSKKLATFGPKHSEFELNLKEKLKVDNVLLFSNGHTALETAIGACKLSGEVITTPFTFVSTTNAIVRNGLTPFFCDVDKNMTIDVNEIEKYITPSTSGIVCTHIMGNVCDVEKLKLIADKYGLKVIYDGAHAFGIKIGGQDVGMYGDATMYSFHATKAFNSAEGGAIVCREYLKQSAEELRYFGMENKNAVLPGGNGKMHELTAALGLCNLKYMYDVIQKRQSLYRRYYHNLHSVPGVEFRVENSNVQYNYIYCYVIIDKKQYGLRADQLISLLNENKIHARKPFSMLTCDMEIYKCQKRGELNNSYFYLNNVVMLPLHTEMSIEDVDTICEIVKRRKR